MILYLGRYAYVGAKPTNAQVARLVSPLISVSLATTKCLSFWYNMYGPSVGSLNVYAKTSSLGSPIWSRNGTQGNQWHQAIDLEIQKNQSFSVSLKVRHINIINDNIKSHCTLTCGPHLQRLYLLCSLLNVNNRKRQINFCVLNEVGVEFKCVCYFAFQIIYKDYSV